MIIKLGVKKDGGVVGGGWGRRIRFPFHFLTSKAVNMERSPSQGHP